MEFTIEEKLEILMRRVAALEKKVAELTEDLSSEEIEALVEKDMK